MNKAIIKEIEDDLIKNILPYWQEYSRDMKNKGFFGDIDNDNKQDSSIERSIVMTSRFLWAYSAAARFLKDSKYLEMADFAYDVIVEKFFDKKNGGVYWSVMPDGTPKVSKKQIYGEAFCCYGLSEYASALKELKKDDEKSEEAMNKSLDIYNLIEKYAYDEEFGGYVEARAIDWSETDDMILSPKDMNCPKSMNTNLHVMEAYTNLYRNLPVVFPEGKNIRSEVGTSLSKLVMVTVEKILQKNAHLGMFFKMDWTLLADEISYGHDIEASWLLWEAATELGDTYLQSEIKDTVVKIAEVALVEGIDKKTGAMENFIKENGSVRDCTRVWWNQAESMTGFYNAYQITGEEKYLIASENVWKWISEKQIDRKGGEWWSAIDESGYPILSEAKGGNWKTAYHSSRADMEILRRTKNI
ncbi:MAG: N-acyl-D-glucosamine 2-epimerase [Treponema sp.]|jgi:cellobiose epimerase|nr:N-acyl-D-glucosamine 2-epimerase [Treponema sp.]